MIYKIYPEQDIEDIAKAIRSRNGSSEKYIVGEMADAINNFDIYSLVGEDNAPYLYRQGPDLSSDYDREHDTIIGGTVVWNQLANPQGVTATGITSTVTNGHAVVSGTSTGTGWFGVVSDIPVIENHVYLALANDYKDDGTNPIALLGNYTSIHNFYTQGTSKIVKNTNRYGSFSFSLNRSNGATYNKEITPQLFDLTAMFGTTIADYIYSLEQANEGAGVAWFKKLFPKPYYEYNTGELKSVEGLESHDMVGFNQWDEEWEVGGISPSTGANVTDNTTIRSKNYIKVCSNTIYYLKSGTGGTFNYRLYDENKAYISGTYVGANNTLTIPSGVSYLRFVMGSSYGTTYNNDICINISDPNRNGEYEPYIKHSYPLDNSLTLRGILKLDSANNLYYDGDIYESDGSVIRKYGVVDLGTLNWAERVSGSHQWIANMPSASITPVYGGDVKALCERYTLRTLPSLPTNGQFIVNNTALSSGSKIICICDESYSSAAEFKTAITGVKLIYSLAEPITAQAEPFSAIQICDPNGTEEYVTTGIPVGHETKYLEVVEI